MYTRYDQVLRNLLLSVSDEDRHELDCQKAILEAFVILEVSSYLLTSYSLKICLTCLFVIVFVFFIIISKCIILTVPIKCSLVKQVAQGQ